jgi:hypothetical protein
VTNLYQSLRRIRTFLAKSAIKFTFLNGVKEENKETKKIKEK